MRDKQTGWARKCTTLSLPTIAASFNRTHVAVIVGVKEREKRLSRESRETVREILKEFGYDTLCQGSGNLRADDTRLKMI